MSLENLPLDLFLYLANFLPDSSINNLLRTQKHFAELLTPYLYDDKVKFQNKPTEIYCPDVYPYSLPFTCSSSVPSWHSEVILNYFRSKPVHCLTRHHAGSGCTLIHVAVRGANTQLAELLLARGLDINARDSRGWTPLLHATRLGQDDMVCWLLGKGADPTISDSGCERSVLLEAAGTCSGTTVQRVVEAVRKRWQSKSGKGTSAESTVDFFAPATPVGVLHAAIFHGDERSVAVLLDNGVSASATDTYGISALALAASQGHDGIIHLLLDRGAEVLTVDSIGRTALVCAAEGSCSTPTIKRLLQAVIDAGGDFAAPVPAGETHTQPEGPFAPLYYFVLHGNFSAVELLVQHDADVLAQTEGGLTALTLALYRYADKRTVYEDVCRLLIEATHRARPDYDHRLPSTRPLTGGTSLHLAAHHGSMGLVSLLVSCGVDVSVLDDQGRSAYDAAVLEGHEHVAQLLSEEMKMRGLEMSALERRIGQPAIAA